MTPLPRLALLLAALVSCSLFCTPALAQRGYGQNPNRNGGGFQGDKPKHTSEQIMVFEGQAPGMAGGHKYVVLTLAPIMGGAPVRALVPNKEHSDEPKAEFMEKIKDLQPHESLVRVELDKMYGASQLKTLYPIEVKPGEKNPNAFVFAERYDDPMTRAPMVALTKYGERLELGVAQARDEKGKMGPDAKVTGELDKVKEGDVVYATFAPGRIPVLTAIYPYKDPQTGKLIKLGEQEVEGQKAPAAEIEGADGSKVTALIPGKIVNKRWVADQNVLREVRAIRPKTDVQFATHDEDGKPVLTFIAKAPPAPREATASGSREMKDKSQK